MDKCIYDENNGLWYELQSEKLIAKINKALA